MALAHLLDRQDSLKGVVAFDTGIHASIWPDFIEKVPYPLELIKTREIYESLVEKFGFPRGARVWHRIFFNRLKDRAMQEFIKRHKGEEYVLASGVRRLESIRRFAAARDAKWHGKPVEQPIFDWPSSFVWDYIRKNDIEISPVAAWGMGISSGDCFCGCFSKVGERGCMKRNDPELYERICRLEEKVGGLWGMRHLPNKGMQGNEKLVCEGSCDSRV